MVEISPNAIKILIVVVVFCISCITIHFTTPGVLLNKDVQKVNNDKTTSKLGMSSYLLNASLASCCITLVFIVILWYLSKNCSSLETPKA